MPIASPEELRRIFNPDTPEQREYNRLRNGSEENLIGLTRLEFLRHQCLKDKIPRHFMTFCMTDLEYARLKHSERVGLNEYFEASNRLHNAPRLYDFIMQKEKESKAA